jgi:hypothetical protein
MRKQLFFIQGGGNKHAPLGSGKLIAYLADCISAGTTREQLQSPGSRYA